MAAMEGGGGLRRRGGGAGRGWITSATLATRASGEVDAQPLPDVESD